MRCVRFGIHTVTGLGDLRNDNDASCTYEGENNVLIQQTSNWLLANRRQGYGRFKEASPLGTAAFLVDFDRIIKRRFHFSTANEAVRPDSKANYIIYGP